MDVHEGSVVEELAPGQHTVGWVPKEVQLGGESGLGEGEPFIAYEWAQGGTWVLPEMEKFLMALRGQLKKGNPYAPWHEHVSKDKEFLNNWNSVGDGNDKYRKRIFRQLSAMGPTTNVFGEPVRSPYFTPKDEEEPLAEAQLKMNLWQVRDADVLKQIFHDTRQMQTGQARGGGRDEGGHSSWDALDKQYIESTDEPYAESTRKFTYKEVVF